MIFHVFIFLTSLSFIFGSTNDPLEDYECLESEDDYIVPDPKRCDRYAVCKTNGVKNLLFCSPGMGFNVSSGDCQEDTNCRNSFSFSSICSESNGYFPNIPDCFTFFLCSGGKKLLLGCPADTVFDTDKRICLQSYETSRKECQGNILTGFDCPRVPLKFGDHNRFSHPEDCSRYYICFSNGQPTLSSCPSPLVFDPLSGICSQASTVEPCKNFYKRNENKELDTGSQAN